MAEAKFSRTSYTNRTGAYVYVPKPVMYDHTSSTSGLLKFGIGNPSFFADKTGIARSKSPTDSHFLTKSHLLLEKETHCITDGFIAKMTRYLLLQTPCNKEFTVTGFWHLAGWLKSKSSISRALFSLRGPILIKLDHNIEANKKFLCFKFQLNRTTGCLLQIFLKLKMLKTPLTSEIQQNRGKYLHASMKIFFLGGQILELEFDFIFS